MSELPESALTYGTVVSEFFLGLRGAGLLLSPLDREQVREWERRGLPVPIVCRGLRRAFEAHAEAVPPQRAPRSVRSCRGFVEAEWRAYASGRVGDAPPPPTEEAAARARLAAARAHLDRPGAAYAAARAALEGSLPVSTLDGAERAIARADAALLGAWLGALDRPARAAIGRRVARLTGARPPGLRRAIHRDALRAHLLDAARAAGLLCLRGSV